MPQNPTTPATTTVAASTSTEGTQYPGKKLGLVGLLLACTVSIVGLVVSCIALLTSLRHGHRNPAAIAGIIIGVLATAVLVAGVFYFVGVLDGNVGVCADREPGVYEEGLMTYTCLDGQ
jgi:hypothetical protein